MRTVYDYLNNFFDKKEDLTIFEIGAHIGQDTKKLLNIFKNSTYYAFECDPRNILKIKQQSFFDKINLIEKAVSNYDGFGDFYQSNGTPKHHSRNNTASSSLYKPTGHINRWPWVTFDNLITVPVCSLDTFCNINNITKIDFIWADVQGGEYNLICGAKNILRNTKYLYTEYSNVELYKDQKPKEILYDALPGSWLMVKDFRNDILFKNKDCI